MSHGTRQKTVKSFTLFVVGFFIVENPPEVPFAIKSNAAFCKTCSTLAAYLSSMASPLLDRERCKTIDADFYYNSS